MKHVVVEAIENALGWDGPQNLGHEFAIGRIGSENLCERLLTPGHLLDTIMRRSLTPPQIRCLQNGEDLQSDAFISRQMSLVNMRTLGRLLRAGCTVVLDAMNIFDPTMEVTCRALQWWSRELVQVNCYLTTGAAAGFPLHWDDHDVLVIQIGGEKSWEVRGRSRIAPMYRDAQRNTSPSEDVIWSGTIQAGDIMHIPRGHWHQATRTDRADGYSLHLTFGITKRTGVDWLTWLADHSREYLPFRRDLDRWNVRPDEPSTTAHLSDDFEALRTRFSPDAYLSAREQEQPPSRHLATHKMFGAPKSVVCVTEFRPTLQRDGDVIELMTVGKRIRLAARAEPALRRLISGYPENLEQLTAQTGVDAAILADALIDEGVCAELTDALAAGYQGLVISPSAAVAP